MRFQFKYKNHKGEVEDRDVDVTSLGFHFMNHPEYGYQPSWAISGWDFSRGRDGSQYRSFYLSNVILPDGIAGGDTSIYLLLNLPRQQTVDRWHSAADEASRLRHPDTTGQ